MECVHLRIAASSIGAGRGRDRQRSTLAGCAEGGERRRATPARSRAKPSAISGGITGIEAENMQKSFDEFTEDTGIIVEYTGDKGFEGNIVTKVQGGDAPDIAIVPQPGLLKTLVETGEVVEAPEAVEANVDENWSPDWKAYGTVDDVFYAAPDARERQGLRLVLAGVIRGVGRRGSDDVGRAARADRDDPGDDRRAAVVRRILVRGGIRLAGHRLDRGPRPAPVRTGGLRPVGRQRGQVHRPRDRGRVRRRRRDPAQPGVRERGLRRRGEHQLDRVRRRRRSGRRPAPAR